MATGGAGEVEDAGAALLAKLEWVESHPDSHPVASRLIQANAALTSATNVYDEAATKAEEMELSALSMAVLDLEAHAAAEDAEISQLAREHEKACANLAAAEAERTNLEAHVQQHSRVEARQQASAKLLQLQLTVATQLYGVAESLSHVAASTSAPKGGGSKLVPSKGGGNRAAWLPNEIRHRDREVEELQRALKRQQQMVSDAHRQLLELTTRKRGKGAAAADITAMRASLAEQEMRRMVAEARCDELQAQVRLFEEQGLRLRLHPAPVQQPYGLLAAPGHVSPVRVSSPRPTRVVGVDLWTPNK